MIGVRMSGEENPDVNLTACEGSSMDPELSYDICQEREENMIFCSSHVSLAGVCLAGHPRGAAPLGLYLCKRMGTLM